jgi:hypothetical protein
MSLYAKPKILFLDIETAPIEAHVWQLWDQNVGLNQIMHDWSVLSWCAKWQSSKRLIYEDVSKQKNKRDDKKILKHIWDLLDEADIVVTQNGRQFDIKKLNARFIINGMHPPSNYRQIDTKVLAKKVFGFTSNKLEYMADKLCKKYKKLKHKKFAGHEMWTECLKGNKAAWREMEKYNKHDVLALEELYNALIAWDNPVNFNVYHKMHDSICSCGSTEFYKNGYYYTNSGKFDRYMCKKCNKTYTSRYNELSLKKRKEMLK